MDDAQQRAALAHHRDLANKPAATTPTLDALSADEIARLESTRNEREWNAVCDDVKAARGGAYPGDWFAKVIMGGLGARAQLGWVR